VARKRDNNVKDPTKGIRTRQVVIVRAMQIAAQEGLGALSIGRLAKELRMSKSGLFIHFGSKQTLELAVIEWASLHFFAHIMVPIRENRLQGIERVWALCDSWLDFTEQERLPGGYFFSGAFFQCARQTGPIPQEIKRVVRDWMEALREAVAQARRRGEIRMAIDSKEAAFELNSILIGAQWSHLMSHTDHTNARLAILAKLRNVATEEISETAFKSVKAWKSFVKNRED
jgi:AcrR family transcriptional regulator